MIFYSVGGVKVPQNMGLQLGLFIKFRKLSVSSVNYNTIILLLSVVKCNGLSSGCSLTICAKSFQLLGMGFSLKVLSMSPGRILFVQLGLFIKFRKI